MWLLLLRQISIHETEFLRAFHSLGSGYHLVSGEFVALLKIFVIIMHLGINLSERKMKPFIIWTNSTNALSGSVQYVSLVQSVFILLLLNENIERGHLNYSKEFRNGHLMWALSNGHSWKRHSSYKCVLKCWWKLLTLHVVTILCKQLRFFSLWNTLRCWTRKTLLLNVDWAIFKLIHACKLRLNSCNPLGIQWKWPNNFLLNVVYGDEISKVPELPANGRLL